MGVAIGLEVSKGGIADALKGLNVHICPHIRMSYSILLQAFSDVCGVGIGFCDCKSAIPQASKY